MDYEQKYNDALKRAKAAIDIAADKDLVKGVATTIFPELRKEEKPLTPFQQCLNCILRGVYYAEVPDEKVNEFILNVVRTRTDELIKLAKKQEEQKHPDGCFTCDEYKKGYEAGRLNGFTAGYNKAMKEVKQKEQKPIIQDVELNDAVYDYVRDHFIAGADFTPEYIKKLMENAFFAGVDYYLLGQESESCEPDTNVEKVIEDVIRVYGKTQGEWVGGYDVDTLIVNLRRAFNKKEQKPAEPSDEELQRHQDELYDFKVFATKQAKEHNISFIHDFEWNNFCAELLSYFNEKQKPAEWSKEDKRMLSRCVKSIESSKNFAEAQTFKEAKDKEKEWLISLPERFNLQPRQEWSEEDEHTIADLINYFEGDALEYSTEEMVQRIKSLHPQPKTEWSEEDEKMIDTIVSILGQYIDYKAVSDTGSGYATPRYSKEMGWLKSLRPSWKPSKEQMDALKHSAYGVNQYGEGPILRELYKQLKNL